MTIWLGDYVVAYRELYALYSKFEWFNYLNHKLQEPYINAYTKTSASFCGHPFKSNSL